MFARNAIGEYLPPMVVYKAQNLYSGWTEGGPHNAVYNVTKTDGLIHKDLVLQSFLTSCTKQSWYKVGTKNSRNIQTVFQKISDNISDKISKCFYFYF